MPDTAPKHFDLFVIGAGSGGVRAARMAARFGATVAIAEERYLGGTCVNVGCVPKKLYVYGSHYSEDFVDARGYGWQTSDTPFNWSTLRDNKTREIERLNGIYQKLLANAGVTIVNGRARITGEREIGVGSQRFTADRILLATGGWPVIPAIPGREFALSSNEIFDLPELPKRIAIVGGGYIAVEFAGIFNGLGSATTLLYRGEKILRQFDHDIADFAAEEITNKGVTLRTNCNVSAIVKNSDGSLQLALTDNSSLVVDVVLFATGRKPLLENIGLEPFSPAMTETGKIAVDDCFQTSIPGIYALGDIIESPELTPVAIAEAMAFVQTHFNNNPQPMNYQQLPTAVFCQPSIGTVGLSEAEARATGSDITVYKTSFRPMKHTLSGRQERTMMKLVVDRATDKVLGAHMVGEAAGEIIQGIAIALKAGATKADFDATIGIHPTTAEEFVTLNQPG